jgi:hypothetical protein
MEAQVEEKKLGNKGAFKFIFLDRTQGFAHAKEVLYH